MKSIFLDPSQKLRLARLASFFGLLFIFINYFLIIIILDNLSMSFEVIITQISLFSFLGVFLGALLCSLFLPNPSDSGTVGRPLPLNITFIVLVVMFNLILRSFGIQVYIDSFPVRALIMVLTGMLSPLVYGLFFLTHLESKKMIGGGGGGGSPQKKNLNKNCTFLFCLAISGAFLIRFFTLPLLTYTGLASDPLKIMSFIYTVIGWLIFGIGVTSAASVALYVFNTTEKYAVKEMQTQPAANWLFIFCLIGIAAIFRILIAITNLRLSPVIVYNTMGIFHPYLLVSSLALFLIGFLSRYISINRFIKWFLPVAIAMFILLPNLLLSETSPLFILIIDILVGLFGYLVWVFFASAIMESYVPKNTGKPYFRGFWFYSSGTVIYFTTIFTFFFFRINRYIPEINMEMTILFSGLTTIALFLLYLRIVFIKNHFNILESGNSLDSELIDVIFREYDLSTREIDVAQLLLKDGSLEAKEISNLLCISPTTVKTHISNIYRKFNVNKRSEFMSVFIKRAED